MQKSFWMRGTSIVTTAWLVLALSIAATVPAEELKPFMTVRFADPETLMSVGEKVADLTGQRRDFEAAVASFKDLKGLNPKGPLGLVLRTDGEEIRDPLLVLPIEKLEEVDLPYFEQIMAGAQKESEGKYVLNFPTGLFYIYQRKGYVIITSSDTDEGLPADPATLFTGLDKFTLGLRVDMENTSLDSIENLLLPAVMFLSMMDQGATLAEGIDEAVKTAHKECRSLTLGISFDPRTAAVEAVASMVPRKDSDAEKQMLAFQKARSIFGGFIENQPTTVLSFNGVEAFTEDGVESTMNGFDVILDGVLETIGEYAETDEEYELAENVGESVRSVVEATLKKGQSDVGLSLDADGTLLFGTSVGDTAELKKVFTALIAHVKGKNESALFTISDEKKEYDTVENFKLSSCKVTVNKSDAHKALETLAGMSFAVVSGMRENEALVLAVGPDAAATEKRLREALAKTKEPGAVRQPAFVFSLQPFGKLLDQCLPQKERDETVAKVTDLLVTATADARISVTTRIQNGAIENRLTVNGKAMEALSNIMKVVSASGLSEAIDKTKIRDF